MAPTSTSNFTLFIPVEPAPASRPKVSRYGVRYAKSHMQYQHDFRRWLEETNTTDWPRVDKELVSVDLEYLCTKARTSRLITPRYDLDNLIKLTLDCFTSSKLLWADDVTVASITAHKRFRSPEDEEAGTWFSMSWPDY